MDLDKLDIAQFTASQVAEITNLDIVTVNTWTGRKLTSPYKTANPVRRAGGLARSYTLRDIFKFALMGEMHRQTRLPLPSGIDICRVVFEPPFNPRNPGLLILEQAISKGESRIRAKWCKNEEEVAGRLKGRTFSLVINVGLIMQQMMERADAFGSTK
jgi:hypothetical protein